MGARTSLVDGAIIEAECDGPLAGNHIYLDVVSVGATMNIMLAASKAQVLQSSKMPPKSRISLTLQTSLNSMELTSGAQVQTLSKSVAWVTSTA